MSFWVMSGQPKDRLTLNTLCVIHLIPIPFQARPGYWAEPGLAIRSSPPVEPGRGLEGSIWAHPVLCKCNTARSGRILKGQKRGCFHQESLLFSGCLCLCVSFSVCVGGRHLSPSTPVFLFHSAWAPVPLCLGFHFLSLL